MQKLKRFLFVYAAAFCVIWIGYGFYAVITSQPAATTILGFGIAFSIVVSAASWFTFWLMGHYKRVDKMAKEMITNANNTRKRKALSR